MLASKAIIVFVNYLICRCADLLISFESCARCSANACFFFYRIKKSQGGRTLGLPGKPDMKAMSENKASNQCLAFMINNVNDLFKVSRNKSFILW